MRYITTCIAAVILTTFAASTAASAQQPVAARSHTQGINLGIHANGSSHKFDDSDVTESGSGLGLRLGWGFSNTFMLYAQADAASIGSADGNGDYALAHVDLGARFTFGNAASAWRPYLDIAANGRGAAQTIEGSDVTITGAGIAGGGGVQYFMTRWLGLDVGLKFTSGKYTEATIDDESFDIDDSDRALSTRVNIGLSWYPGG